MSERTDSTADLADRLVGYSTRQLAEILAQRSDLDQLVQPDGRVSGAVWPLRTKLGAVPCVDGVIVKQDPKTGQLLGGVIRRRTGRFPGKLAIVGGVVGLYQSIEDALKFHYKSDLGIDVELPLGWAHPVCMRQYAPQMDGRNRNGFSHDPGKHSYASTHIVTYAGTHDQQVVFGVKSGDNQAEASGLEWYSLDTLPIEGEWSYDMSHTFVEVMLAAHRARAQGYGYRFGH